MSQRFCNILIYASLQFNQWEVPAVVIGSTVVVGALTRYESIHSLSDLKAVQMNA